MIICLFLGECSPVVITDQCLNAPGDIASCNVLCGEITAVVNNREDNGRKDRSRIPALPKAGCNVFVNQINKCITS